MTLVVIGPPRLDPAHLDQLLRAGGIVPAVVTTTEDRIMGAFEDLAIKALIAAPSLGRRASKHRNKRKSPES